MLIQPTMRCDLSTHPLLHEVYGRGRAGVRGGAPREGRVGRRWRWMAREEGRALPARGEVVGQVLDVGDLVLVLRDSSRESQPTDPRRVGHSKSSAQELTQRDELVRER